MTAPHPAGSPNIVGLFWGLVAASWLYVGADVWRRLR